jgi:uncharacterized cupredoxin-like copper-binding protein
MLRFIWQPVRVFSIFIVAALALAACGGSSSTSNNPVNVQVTLSDFKIDSSLTTFKVGVPYHFTVINHGAAAHQMAIMPPTNAQLTIAQVKQMALAGITDGINPGATQTFDYTFTKEYPAGSLEFACHLPGHYEAGMHTPIVVTK